MPPEKVAMKILYTPHTNFTESVMNKAAKVFQTFEYVQEWAWQIRNCSDEFLINFPPDSAQANNSRRLLSILLDDNSTDIPQILRPGVDLLRQNFSLNTSSLETAQQLLNESAPGNIWEIVTTIRDVSSGIYNMLDRFDWDMYFPVSDEGQCLCLGVCCRMPDPSGGSYCPLLCNDPCTPWLNEY